MFNAPRAVAYQACHYEYRYTLVNSDTCAFRALPARPRCHYASAYFVVVAPRWLRVWQGKALSDEQITGLSEVAALRELAELRLAERTARR